MTTTTIGPDGTRVYETAVHDHAHHHGLCWSAIIAGAFAAAALALILAVLGFGLGLSSVSPWSFRGVSASTLADGAIAWLVFSQIVASGMGGFLADACVTAGVAFILMKFIFATPRRVFWRGRSASS